MVNSLCCASHNPSPWPFWHKVFGLFNSFCVSIPRFARWVHFGGMATTAWSSRSPCPPHARRSRQSHQVPCSSPQGSLRRVAVPGGPTILHGMGEHMTVVVEVTYEFPVFFSHRHCRRPQSTVLTKFYTKCDAGIRRICAPTWCCQVARPCPGRPTSARRCCSEVNVARGWHSRIWQSCPLSAPGCLVLVETFSFDSHNVYICVYMTADTLGTSQLSEDFATINCKDCFEVNCFQRHTITTVRRGVRSPAPAAPAPLVESGMKHHQQVTLNDQ